MNVNLGCVLVLGAGTMDQQIALQCAAHVCDVIVYVIANAEIPGSGV